MDEAKTGKIVLKATNNKSDKVLNVAKPQLNVKIREKNTAENTVAYEDKDRVGMLK